MADAYRCDNCKKYSSGAPPNVLDASFGGKRHFCSLPCVTRYTQNLHREREMSKVAFDDVPSMWTSLS